MNNQKGVTLLEILVGVTIFAVSLSIAAGVFSQTSRYQEKAQVSRSIDQDIRNSSSMIANDIRNSQGVIGVDDSNVYYNFAGYNNYRSEPNTKPKLSTENSKILRVNLSEGHRRQYYLSSDRLVSQDIILEEGNWEYSDPQPMAGENVKVTGLSFNVKTPNQSKNIEDPSSYRDQYPWVKIVFEAEYIDARERPELRGEKITFDTVISPRNFSFID
jgi:prepilin-type N-terminal cleavage/methylation domain-containing protein